MPTRERLDSMVWWRRESKAFDRSNATQPTLRSELRCWCQSFVAARRASWVELWGLKPNWCLEVIYTTDVS